MAERFDTYTDNANIEIPEFVVSDIKNNISVKGAVIASQLSSDVKSWLIDNQVSAGFLWNVYIKNDALYFSHRVCPECGAVIDPSKTTHRKHHQFCSSICAGTSDIVKTTRSSTNIKKFGIDNPAKLEVSTIKAKATSKARYGVESYTQTTKYAEQVKQTSIEKYGVDSPNKATIVKQHKVDSCRQKYGVDNAAQTDLVKEKIKQTFINNYGVDNPNKTQNIRGKIKKTNRLRYGYDCVAFQDPQIRSSYTEKVSKNHRIEYYDTFARKVQSNGVVLLSTKEQYIDDRYIKVKCNHCGIEWEPKTLNPNQIHCPECARKAYSIKEKILLDFIKSLYNGSIIENTRKILPDNKELDIYLPDLKLAFEFDGTFWHNSDHVNKTFHQKKTLDCRKLGIRLIHIFEHEWDTKRGKIENLIRSSLGIFDKKIYARNCKVTQINSDVMCGFLDEHHMQKSINCSIRYGLFYNNELISVIGFGKSRFKEGEFELYRYCVKSGYLVVGGFSKLIKHANVRNFVSYIDLSHYSGIGYDSIGFTQISITDPNYIYIKGSKNTTTIVTRIQAQKHRLPELLGESFDPDLSETENMTSNGWHKIYDCGNIKVEYDV